MKPGRDEKSMINSLLILCLKFEIRLLISYLSLGAEPLIQGTSDEFSFPFMDGPL